MLRDAGRYVVVGQYTDGGDVAINPHRHINRRHASVLGCWGYEFSHLHRALADDAPAPGPVPLGRDLVTREYPLVRRRARRSRTWNGFPRRQGADSSPQRMTRPCDMVGGDVFPRRLGEGYAPIRGSGGHDVRCSKFRPTCWSWVRARPGSWPRCRSPKAGLSVEVIDEEWRPAGHSYALALHPRSLSLLAELGLAGGRSPRPQARVADDPRGRRAARHDPLRGASTSASRSCCRCRRARSSGCSPTRWRGWGSRSAGATASPASSPAATPSSPRWSGSRRSPAATAWLTPSGPSAARSSFRAGFVIGADGHRSLVRRALGTPLDEAGPSQVFAIFECLAPERGRRGAARAARGLGERALAAAGRPRALEPGGRAPEVSAADRFKGRLTTMLGERFFPHLDESRTRDLLAPARLLVREPGGRDRLVDRGALRAPAGGVLRARAGLARGRRRAPHRARRDAEHERGPRRGARARRRASPASARPGWASICSTPMAASVSPNGASCSACAAGCGRALGASVRGRERRAAAAVPARDRRRPAPARGPARPSTSTAAETRRDCEDRGGAPASGIAADPSARYPRLHRNRRLDPSSCIRGRSRTLSRGKPSDPDARFRT